MAYPRLTHLQFMLLGFLQQGPTCGQELRDALRSAGVRRSGPGFYQLMSRLEDSGFVRGRYEQRIVSGQIIRQRCYELTALGGRAWRDSRDFYAKWSARFEKGPLPA